LPFLGFNLIIKLFRDRLLINIQYPKNLFLFIVLFNSGTARTSE